MKTENKKRLFQRIQSRIGKFLRVSAIISAAAFFAGSYSLNPALAVTCPAGQQDFDHNGTCESVCNENLKFSPPAMTNPLIVHVTDSGVGDEINLTYPTTQDVIIYMPTDRDVTGTVDINGGRNVRIVGGHWNLKKGDACLYINQPSKSIFVEGSYFSNGQLADPDIMAFRSYNGGTGYDLYFQNIYAYAPYAGNNHVDMIQDQAEGGPIGNIYVENFTGLGGDQGLFFQNQGPGKGFYVRNTDLTFVPPYATGALIWLNGQYYMGDPSAYPPLTGTFENTYITNNRDTRYNWYDSGIWPKHASISLEETQWQPYHFEEWGTVPSADGKSVTFKKYVAGSINYGMPPGGSFVLASDTGLNFRSKWDANCGTTPPPTPPPPTPPPPTPPPATVTGDLNGDGAVNATDFSVIKTDFLKLTASLTNPKSDIDADGQCTIKDVGILMSAWK